ncbi:MAG TPA: glycoside hydrolase family 3 N-terminal domain-containing protein [Ktedonobacterales bacterium]
MEIHVVSRAGHAVPERATAPRGLVARLARRFDRRAMRLEKHAQQLLAQMGVAEKIGQLVIPIIFPANADEVRLSQEIRALVAEHHIGGYFICAAGASAEQVRAFTEDLQAAARIPLILASDFEGGDWNFLRSAVGPRPWPAAIAAMGDAKVAYYKGVVDAELLQALGVNVNFAPSVDVLTNPDSPVLANRTFGTSPEVVAQLAAAYVDGLAASGVAGCLKHFPGLGAATVDPHVGLPHIMRTRDEITSVELLPYRNLLRSGHAPMIMTTHILMPTLDPHLPTSLSPVVIDDLLRRVLGYDGVVISDSLAMGGVEERYSVAEAAVLAFEAGTDLLLGAPDFEQTRASIAALHAALADGRVTQRQVDAAVLRVLRFKLGWRIIPPR